MNSFNKISLLLVSLYVFSTSDVLLAQEYKPQWKPDSSSPFEVGTQLRPWTIADEGMDYILDNCQQMAGVNNIYLVLVMHQEHRPYKAEKFPHNPKRETFQAEDSRVNFFPDMSHYGRIKPQLSDYDWIREKDWMQYTIDACRERGLGVGAEVSHFPIPKKMLMDNPEFLQVDIHGNVIQKPNFCPNNPDVRKYLLALFGDLAANYEIDYIQTCQYLFTGLDLDQGGGCFCMNCKNKALEMGIDLETAQKALSKNKDAQPERGKWEEFRYKTSTEVFKEISEAIHRENSACQFRLNDVYSWNSDPHKRGLDLTEIGKHIGSLVNQDHQEQLGHPDEDFSWRKQWLTTNRNHLGYDKPFLTGVAPRMNASPELVRRGIKVAVQHPAQINGLALKHYDGASFSLLRAFKQGMIEAGVQGLAPTLGKEVEDMELDGYEKFDKELAEEWGVKTRGEGKASYEFDLPSGTYDVRISYFDGPAGESQINLFVNGTSQASFSMDENTDCWRWRMFKDIKIQKGDQIQLRGKAHEEEQACLDFIEFIRK